MSRAHVFFSSKQKSIDRSVKSYCTNQENCRRVALLRAIGSSEAPASSLSCCDVCGVGTEIADKLLFEASVSSSKRRRKAVRRVDEDLSLTLKSRLTTTRDQFIDDHPHIKMIGPSFVCSSSVIDDICSSARFIDSVECIRTYPIHPQLCPLIFSALCDILKDAPPPRSRRRRVGD